MIDHCYPLASITTRFSTWFSPVFVQPPEGQILKLQVRAMFTIADIKAIAGSMLGFSIKLLGHAGKQLLNDSRSLASFNIKDGSLLLVLSMTFQIFVRTCSRKSTVLNVHSQTTIADLKGMNYQNSFGATESRGWGRNSRE